MIKKESLKTSPTCQQGDTTWGLVMEMINYSLMTAPYSSCSIKCHFRVCFQKDFLYCVCMCGWVTNRIKCYLWGEKNNKKSIHVSVDTVWQSFIVCSWRNLLVFTLCVCLKKRKSKFCFRCSSSANTGSVLVTAVKSAISKEEAGCCDAKHCTAEAASSHQNV